MSWNIRVWHEEFDETTRMCIEAGPDVPEDVIATIASTYWIDEVQQFTEVPWEEGELPPDSGMHG
jgi:hypothetical protein